MNLFQVLSKNERVIVFSSEEDGYIYTWNQDKVLQCWENVSCEAPDWRQVNILKLETKPHNFAEARKAAQEWYLS